MSNETKETGTGDEMGQKLDVAAKKAEQQKAERRAKVIKGAHLNEKFLAPNALAGLTVEEKSGWTKITGQASGKAVYVAKKGGRVDLSGFSVESPAVNQITPDEAKAKHIGKVRGQLNFDASDDDVIAAYEKALATLAIPDPTPAPVAQKETPAAEATA